jgi:hypothetical protein
LGEFHASMEQVGTGLYPAAYSGEINSEHPDERDDFHVGTSVADVTTWVEQMAFGFGYDRVIWGKLPR